MAVKHISQGSLMMGVDLIPIRSLEGFFSLQGSLMFHPTDHGDLQLPRRYHHFSVAFYCSFPVLKAGPSLSQANKFFNETVL